MGGLVLMEISMVNWTDGNGNLSKIPTASFSLHFYALVVLAGSRGSHSSGSRGMTGMAFGISFVHYVQARGP